MQPPDPRDRRIGEVEAALAEGDALIARLLARIEALEAQVATLTRNSTNSSKPSSSDPLGVVRPPHNLIRPVGSAAVSRGTGDTSAGCCPREGDQGD